MPALAVLQKGVSYKPYLVGEGRDVAKTPPDLRTARPSRCCGRMAPGTSTFFLSSCSVCDSGCWSVHVSEISILLNSFASGNGSFPYLGHYRELGIKNDFVLWENRLAYGPISYSLSQISNQVLHLPSTFHHRKLHFMKQS